MLRYVGYATSMIGKWHCGFLPWFSPTRSDGTSSLAASEAVSTISLKSTNFCTYDFYEQ